MRRYIIELKIGFRTYYWTQKSYGFSSTMMSLYLDSAAVFDSETACLGRIAKIMKSIKAVKSDPTLTCYKITETLNWGMLEHVKAVRVRLQIVENRVNCGA